MIKAGLSVTSELQDSLERLRRSGLLREGLLIDGNWVGAADGGTLDVCDPASGEKIAEVASATRDDALRAVATCEVARRIWGGRPASERATILFRLRDLIMANLDDLSLILTAEQGKPLAEARGEVTYGAAFIGWYAEEARRVYGDIIPTNLTSRRLLALKQPIGVVGAITPWNFPAAMILRKSSPALAAGCGIVLKPASETPLTALALGELANRAGLPPGVFNIVHGDPVLVGSVLTSSPLVRMLTFTGSTEVGKLIMSQCAATVKRVALELGGNAPLIVFDDADLDSAVKGALDSKFRNAGQTCVCANRILVQEAIHDRFVDAFSLAVKELRVGNGLDPEVTQGPLIDENALTKVEHHISDAIAKGARVVTGGKRHALGGTFFQPTVLIGASKEMAIANEETFGPVAPIFKFSSEDEAITLANSSESGLAAYFFTRDLGRTFRVGEALEFGVVGVNTGTISYEGAPFGGVKESGLGREGSRHGIEEFVEIKYLCIDGLQT